MDYKHSTASILLASVYGLAAAPAGAQCIQGQLNLDGTELAISVQGKAPLATQKILVIPVVDRTFAYTPNNRGFAGSSFEQQLEKIRQEYATNMRFWSEASYGNVVLEAVVPSCFYQIDAEFPTIDEEPFRRASLTGIPIDLSALAFETITLTYTSGPELTPNTTTFTANPTTPFDSPEALLAHLQSQLGSASGLEVDLVADGALSSLRFQIPADLTFVGSRIDVDIAASDPNSRRVLGLVAPTLTQIMSGQVAVTTDGARLPGWGYDPGGSTIVFQFTGSPDAFDDVYWNWSGACTGLGTSGCPTWTNAAELSDILNPSSGELGSIVDTNATGRPEFQFLMNVDQGVVFDTLTINPGYESGRLNARMMQQLGLSRMKAQVGTASAIQLPGTSLGLTSQALQSFLEQELYGADIGCVSPEIGIGGTGLKDSADDYLRTFSAIHTYLLSSGEVQRDNAGHHWLCADVDTGNGVQSYKVHSPVALVEVGSGEGTIAHETGHNIGFPDLYDNSNTWWDEIESDYHPNLTFPGRWDIMHDSSGGGGDLSHPSAFTKQFRNAWIQQSGVTNNGQVQTVLPDGVTRQFLITPLERPSATYDDFMTPPAGVTLAKMVILPFGSATTSDPTLPGHFIAIENRQEGEEFSRRLPGFQDFSPSTFRFREGGVRVSDNMSELNIGSQIKRIARNYSHTLTRPPYPDAGGMSLTVGTTLDTLQTFPSYPGITIETVGVVPGPDETEVTNEPPSYLVNVTYIPTETLDLQIKSWLAPDQYATNAIWFEPATTSVPPANPMIPDQNSADPVHVGNVNAPIWFDGWQGEVPLNWVHVLVKNDSTYDLENVRVKATFNSPGGAGDGAAWEPVSPNAFSQYKNMVAGESAVFSVPWNPDRRLAQDGHTCVAVEVVDWEVPGLGHVADINPFNNLAQENIHSMEMKSSSPWQEVPFQFEVYNSYDHDVPVEIEPLGLRPGYRLNLPTIRAHLAAGDSHIFEGTFSWDSTLIPTPPNQDPFDPYWEGCESGTGSTTTIVYPAETFEASIGYGTEGSGWVLDGVGHISKHHDFAGGSTKVTVLAAGAEADGIWPRMEVSVDGVVIGAVDVNSGYLLAYEFSAQVVPGVHELRVTLTNGLNNGYSWRAMLVDEIEIESISRPPHCGGIWGLAAYALKGDYRVPIGGSSFSASAKPVATLETLTTVDPNNGEITVTGTLDPPHPGQDVRIYVEYPSGIVDIIVLETDSSGSCSTTFPPRELGPVTIHTELPRGGKPFASTDREETVVEACIPTSGEGGNCTDGIQNQAETGVDCGGPCPQACPVPCTTQVHEAEAMYHSTGGPTAGGWNIWSNGYISTTHDFTAGPATLQIVAKGEQGGGAWPHMRVLVGGILVQDLFVNSPTWQSYSIPIVASGGAREVRIEFDNDFNGGAGNDRNLLIDKVTVTCNATGAIPAYSFESGTAGWTNISAPGVSSSTSQAHAFHGAHALAFQVNGSGDPVISVTPTSPPGLGTTISVRVFIPNNAPVVAVSPYILDSNWTWSDGYTASFIKGTWQTFTVTVPPGASMPLNRIGVKFHMNGSYSGPLYIDAVDW